MNNQPPKIMTKTKVRTVKQSTKLSRKNVTQKLQKKRVELSAVVVAHNEERQLEDCLNTLKFVDEIVVVLDKCTDRSKDIAKKYANKIVEGSWEIEGIRRNKSSNTSDEPEMLVIKAEIRPPVQDSAVTIFVFFFLQISISFSAFFISFLLNISELF